MQMARDGTLGRFWSWAKAVSKNTLLQDQQRQLQRLLRQQQFAFSGDCR
jgi:hypothetical protein